MAKGRALFWEARSIGLAECRRDLALLTLCGTVSKLDGRNSPVSCHANETVITLDRLYKSLQEVAVRTV